MDAKQENAAEREATPRLISIRDLEESLKWGNSDQELNVDPSTLKMRLETLAEAERVLCLRKSPGNYPETVKGEIQPHLKCDKNNISLVRRSVFQIKVTVFLRK